MATKQNKKKPVKKSDSATAEVNKTKASHEVLEPVEIRFELTPELAYVLKKICILFQCRLEWLAFLIDQNASFAQDDEPDKELEWRQKHKADLMQQIVQYDSKIAQCEDSQLLRLITMFDLRPPEIAILQTCLAVRFDPTLRNQLGLIQNTPGHNYLNDYAIARLWCFGRGFNRPRSIALMVWGLIRDSVNEPSIEVDGQVFAWLLGDHQLHPLLEHRSNLVPTHEPLSNWPLVETVEHIVQSTQNRTQKGTQENSQSADQNTLLVQIASFRGQGKKTFAALVSKELGLPLLVVDTQRLNQQDLLEVYLSAQRQAFLDGCALGWQNLEHPLPNNQQTQSHCDFPVQFIFTQQDPGADIVLQPSAHFVELPALSEPDKESLLQQYVFDYSNWSADQQQELQKKILSVADIALSGANNDKDLSALNRRASQENKRLLSSLAGHLSTPFTREDWIVNNNINEIFDDIIFEGQERDELWESSELDRLFPRGKGLIAMLTGPSGTGKTMGVQVAAREFGMELFRVDLSRVVSKYIGETSENLANIIQRAERLNVVILFDEADALFSKRTDVKDSIDRHSNMDVNYLLQAVEDYSGIAFLATNKKSNIDQSFIRRLRYVVDFPLPEYPQRLQLWQRLIVSLASDQLPPQHEQICERLAKQIELTGAEIKYAILSALFIAKRMQENLNIQHLMEGITREMLKDGRSLAEHERAAILKGLRVNQLADQKVAV